MEVELISCPPKALTLLLRTKNARLANNDDPERWPTERQMAELEYMRDTIKSSWEFVDYVFEITGVSRAFTHQFVRTRNASYAQESQRTIDARENGFLMPKFRNAEEREHYELAVKAEFNFYSALVDDGMAPQNARNILGTGVLTSIIAKFNLRTLHEMAITRLCVRTQGEYQEVFRAMKAAVIAVHPWAEPFIRVGCATNGVCVFPRYTQCPIQKFTLNAQPGYKARVAEVAAAAEALRHEAHPVAQDGRTM